MKNLKFLAVALVAMLGFAACDKETEHIYDDHSADIVGTWSCLTENYAEVIIINADGSAVSYGVEDGEYWENVRGTVTVKENNITMTFEDDDNFTGHFDIIPGMAFSLFEDTGERYIYQYCANDLSDEILGMWVCADGPQDIENEIIIRTYDKNGKVTTTGLYTEEDDANPTLNSEANYKVVGDLVFKEFPKDIADKTGITHNAERLIFTPKATASGDIMTFLFYLPVGDSYIESHSSYLHIKQSLDLPGMKYDYNNTYVSNVKGLDEDMTMMGYTFNIGKMEGKNLDKMLKTLLFAVEFPNANTLKYQYLYNGQNFVFEARIVVDGNKVTIKMSEMHPYYRDVDMYMFQDKDNTQLHMYMPTSSFINYFDNMDVAALAYAGEIDVTDAAAVEAIFDRMDERVESINVSFVLKARK